MNVVKKQLVTITLIQFYIMFTPTEKMELQLEKARKKLKNNSSSEPNFESLNHIPCASDKSPPKTMETSENNVNKQLTTLSDGGEEENNSKIENVQKKFREIDSSHFTSFLPWT